MPMNDSDFPKLVKVNAHIPPDNISLFSEIKSINVNAPAGVSVHQDLGCILCETMPGHNWRIENNLRESDAVAAFSLPYYSPSHTRGHIFRKIDLIWEIPAQ